MKAQQITIVIAVILCAGVGVGAYYTHHSAPLVPQVTQVVAAHGDIAETSIATGTLTATRTVSIGTQVSGIVKKLYVDYNSIVQKNEVIAQLDDAIMLAQVASAESSVDQVKSNRVGHKAQFDEDQRNLTREREMMQQSLTTAQEFEQAEVTVKSDQAQLDEDDRSIESAEANVLSAKTNLDLCTIRSPIDGVVISRNVDEGQAVASSMTAPTLFVLGTDLSELLLMGDMDESDIGNVRPGEPVRFTVAAYPNTFDGHVTEMRLSPNTTNTVVTYQTVVSVLNPDLMLRPGMTATYRIETGRANGVLRVPNQALRFRPTPEMFAVLHEAVPPPLPPAKSTVLTDAAIMRSAASAESAGTIDTRFAPVQHVERPGALWIIDHQQLERVPVVTGLSDGAWTEIVSGDVRDGEELVSVIMLPKRK